HFFRRQPMDIELVIQLGASVAESTIEIYDPAYHQMASGSPGTGTKNNSLAIRLREARIDLKTGSGLAVAFPGVRQFLLDQFGTSDREKRGYLDAKQIQGNSFLTALLPTPESGGERKLSREEFAALVDLLGKALASSVVITISDHGRDLFAMLNSRHD